MNLKKFNNLKVKLLLKLIVLIFPFLLIFYIGYLWAKEPLYTQYRPSFRSEMRKDCSKSLAALLTEEQSKTVKDLQKTFYIEAAPIRRDLISSNIDFRQYVLNTKIDPNVLLDRQKKILELQSKLEHLSLFYQLKARSIFTNEQLDQLPWDCMLGMGTEFGINVGIGRGSRRGYRR